MLGEEAGHDKRIGAACHQHNGLALAQAGAGCGGALGIGSGREKIQLVLLEKRRKIGTVQKDRDFHLQLYSLSRMHHLLAVDSHLLDYVEGFLNTRRYSPEDISLFIQQHKDILTAMREKDEEKLMEAMRRNILVGLELMQDEMKRLKRH